MALSQVVYSWNKNECNINTMKLNENLSPENAAIVAATSANKPDVTCSESSARCEMFPCHWFRVAEPVLKNKMNLFSQKALFEGWVAEAHISLCYKNYLYKVKPWNSFFLTGSLQFHTRSPDIFCPVAAAVDILTAAPNKHGWRKSDWRRRWKYFIWFTCHHWMAARDGHSG